MKRPLALLAIVAILFAFVVGLWALALDNDQPGWMDALLYGGMGLCGVVATRLQRLLDEPERAGSAGVACPTDPAER